MPEDPGEPRPRVGFIGLGKMGAPMARRLTGAGLAVAVHDARPEVASAFAEETGALACANAADVGRRSTIVITMLPSGEAVRSAVAGDDGTSLLDGLAPGGLLVDMSSAAPRQTRDLGADVRAAGSRMVDAPVSGGVTKAVNGSLAIMVGGHPSDIDRCSDVLAHMGDRIFLTGPLGTGHAVKALNNAVSAAGLIAAAEALIAGKRAGVEPTVMLGVLNASTGRNNATENKIGQFVFSRSFASGFELRLMAKDLGIAVELADAVDADAALLHVTQELVAASQAHLLEAADHTELVRWLEERAGTSLAGDLAAELRA